MKFIEKFLVQDKKIPLFHTQNTQQQTKTTKKIPKIRYYRDIELTGWVCSVCLIEKTDSSLTTAASPTARQRAKH